MLPYEIVFIPFTVITIALTLYFTLLMKLRPSTEVKLSTYIEKTIEQKPRKKNRKTSNAAKASAPPSMEPSIKDEIEEKDCPHYVGYLTTLTKGSPFPDECFGFRRVIQCLRIQPTKVIESFYLATPETEKEAE
jgi:hypothetical protein